MRAIPLLLAACVLLAATPSPTPPPCVSRAPIPERRHASGIILLPPIDLCALRAIGSIEDRLGWASHNARMLAESYPDVLGHPWADRRAHQIVMAVTGAEGEALVRRWMREGAHTTPRFSPHKTELIAPPEVEVRIRTVTRSYAELERIKYEATMVRVPGQRDDEIVFSSGVDEEHQRVVLEVRVTSDALLFALAARYGADAVAVRVDPSAGPFVPLSASLPRPDADPLPLAIAGAAALLLVVFAAWTVRRRVRRTERPAP